MTIAKGHPNFDPGSKAEEIPMLLFHVFLVLFGIFYLIYTPRKKRMKQKVLFCFVTHVMHISSSAKIVIWIERKRTQKI